MRGHTRHKTMSKITELIGSLSNENVDEVKELLASEAEASEKSSSQLYTRAKKAEGFEKKDGQWIKKEKKEEPKVDDKKAEKSKLDFGEKAFLKAYGIEGSEALDFIASMRERTGDELDILVNDEIVTAKLKAFKDASAAKDAIPSKTNRSNQSDAKENVDYWIKKGELPKDTELRKKVVNAKLDIEKSANSAPTAAVVSNIMRDDAGNIKVT